MRIEPKQAFYNEDTGAVQPWKDIEVTDAVGNALVAEGFATEIEGGGGGGSDFSTAEVTIVNNGSAEYEGHTTYIATLPWGDEGLDNTLYVDAGDSVTFTCVLYKGENMLGVSGYTAVLDGDAELASVMVIIKGDCTITLTDAT